MKHGSLFSGGGGFDLAAEWMGWENVFHCEINKFCQRILKYYWPEAITYEDITTTDFTIHRGGIDILTGGFPCQPYSAAGKRKGKEDERHLWPHMLRAIQEIQPRIIVGENVLGLLNWNGGMVFDEVCADLEAAGYYNTITPERERKVVPVVLPAAGVNAPHQRYRVWFVVTNAAHVGYNGRTKSRSCERESNAGEQGQFNAVRGKPCGHSGNATNANINERSEGRMHKAGQQKAERHAGTFNSRNDRRAWENFPTQSPVCFRDDVISSQLDGITFSKWREESIKMAGNAVVPELVYQIFKSIEQVNNDATDLF